MNLRVRIGSLVLGVLAAFWAAHVLAEDPPAAPVADETTSDESAAPADSATADSSADKSASSSNEATATEDNDKPVEDTSADESKDEGDANGPNPGLADLDKATQLKINAENLPDLNDVIDKIDSALEKGLDKDNQKFANDLLVSSLLQRATVLSAAVLDQPIADPRRDPRWMQVRQFAVNDLQRVFELDPNISESHLLMGRLQALPAGDPKTAKRELTKVIDAKEATPEDQAQAHAIRGTLQTEEEKRAADFDAAVKLLPYKPDYYRIRAQYLLSQDKYDAALADVNKALELEPDHAMTQELQGLVLLGLKKFDEAGEAFKKASELAPEAVLPYQHLGEVYRQQGDLKKSAEQLTKALEIKPDDAPTLLLRANLYYQLKDNEAALKDADAAIKANPQLLVAHLLQAEILVAENRIDEAIANLEKIVPLAPNQTRLLEPLATFYLVGGQPRKSIETFTKVLEAEPENFRALRFRGDANLNIGNHAAAVSDFDEALKLDGDDEGLLNNFAWVLATSPDDKVRDGKRALELATKAADMSSHSVPHILSTLAAAYAETGDFENAQKWSAKAVELGENDEAREQLGKELESYKAGKPWREKQEQDDKTPAPSANDHTSTPPVETKQPADKLEL
ncbi:MAG: tetratricopeptide repeat protein [Pirellulales bacterium]